MRRGLVVAIPIAVGQAVRTGDTVAIIEAMKMRAVHEAERDGGRHFAVWFT